MTYINTIVTLIIGLAGPYLVYKAATNGKKLDKIEVHVDGRLSEALDEIKKLQKLVSTSQQSGKSVPKK